MVTNQRPTDQEFLQWRSPVRGTENPEEMNNPFWAWCVRSGENAYVANQTFQGPDSMTAGPCWCFQRFGQAKIELPDGRRIYIAGEHEDSYDPDFYIYNDVVIIDANDDITILGYPAAIFPPTDFHTATIVGQELLLIGNLGYPEDRVVNETQVLRLNLENWQVTPVPTTGSKPGWIHGHSAEFSEEQNAIIITGGEIFGERLLENIDDYKLCLETYVWTNVTEHQWERWILERTDGNRIDLYSIRIARWNRELGGWLQDGLDELDAEMESEIGVGWRRPTYTDDQLDLIGTLYQSPFSDELATKDDDETESYTLDVDGITVRFNEGMSGITVAIEGELPPETVRTILTTLQQRLSELERTSYVLTRIVA